MNLTTIKQLAVRAALTAAHVFAAALLASAAWNVSAVHAALLAAIGAGVSVVWNGLSAAGVPLPSTLNQSVVVADVEKLAHAIASKLPRHSVAVVVPAAPTSAPAVAVPAPAAAQPPPAV